MVRHRLLAWVGACAIVSGLPAHAAAAISQATVAEPTFEVAVIRPSAARVPFERNGRTEVSHGRLQMRDVTVSSCAQWAYGISEGLLLGPASLRESRYDITAKAEEGTTQAQMRRMLQTLLHERFGLTFHHEQRDLKVYTLQVAKGGLKMRAAAPEETFFRDNSATGTVARAMTMKELAEFLSDPLDAPVADGTGLPGRWDFTIDFTPYVEMERREGDVKPDVAAVLGMALKADLGLEMVRERRTMEVTVVDRIETPTAN